MNKELLSSITEAIKNQRIKRDNYVVAFDLDETLWGFVPLNSKEEPEPIWKNIDVVNELFEYNTLTIILYTARPAEDSEEVIFLLKKFGVNYHSIQFGKMRFDVLVDDKCINPHKP